jgi:hypothetical protein
MDDRHYLIMWKNNKKNDIIRLKIRAFQRIVNVNMTSITGSLYLDIIVLLY